MSAPEQQPALTLTEASVVLAGQTVLDNITLSVPSQSIYGILGPNGAGKSTILSLALGLRGVSSGTVAVFDQAMSPANRALRQRIGVVLQETSLYEELTIVENLQFAASLYAVNNAQDHIDEALKLLGLHGRAHARVDTLSGGLKRRVSIARALVHQPELLIIDEPTLGVDVETRHAIWQHLRYLRSQGHTVVVATNHLDEAQALCDTVCVLSNGHVVTEVSPEELLLKAGHRLEVECPPDTATELANHLSGRDDVISTQTSAAGLIIAIGQETLPQDLLADISAQTPESAWHFRPADLAEVFTALGVTQTTHQHADKVGRARWWPTVLAFAVILIIVVVLLIAVISQSGQV